MRQTLINTLKALLTQIVNDIECGNTNASDEELLDFIDVVKKIARKDDPLSKYQAYTYLNISRAKFDNLVREGRLPKGQKVPGFKELRWYKRDLKI